MTPRALVFCLALIATLAVGSGRAWALDPALEISQYAHTAWRVGEGITTARPSVLAQTPDGYLWLGTEDGLWRFDGVRSTPFDAPPGSALPSTYIRALLVARDGTLWIGTLHGLAAWNGTTLVTNAELQGMIVNEIAEDRDGILWVTAQSATSALLCTIQGGKTDCRGADGSLGDWSGSVYGASDGDVWVAAARGVARWRAGAAPHYLSPPVVASVPHAFLEAPAGALLLLTRDRIQQLVGDRLVPFPAALPPQLRMNAFSYDRDGGLWIASANQGLLRLYDGKIDSFTHIDGLSADEVYGVFEDREGTIWVATREGLDRFRVPAVARYSLAQGMPGFGASVLADQDGSVWIGSTAGLLRAGHGRFSLFRPAGEAAPMAPQTGLSKLDLVEAEGIPVDAASLFRDSSGRLWIGSLSDFGYLRDGRFVRVGDGRAAGLVDAMVEDADHTLWLAHRRLGLLRLSPDLVLTASPGGMITSGSYSRLALDPVRGGLWLGLFWGGLAHYVDGAVRDSYSTADGLGRGAVNDVRVTPDGTVWAATEGGLSRVKNGRVATLSRVGGLPCDSLDSSILDDDGATWLYAACGLVRITAAELSAWEAAIDQGRTPARVQTMLLDSFDGARGIAVPIGSYTPHMAKAQDGKLWAASPDGVMVVDPRHIPFNPLPPPVHVEQIVADRQSYAPAASLALPPLLRDLEIDYTALSLVAPQKMRFRYRLEGRDRDWQEAGNRRQAFYTDLAPGQYRFRVIASNNSGVWNEQGAALDLSIAAAYWQTGWFIALCAAILVALLGAAYRLRLRQLARAAAQAEAIEDRNREMRLQLAHANRLATMGQLTGSIAHEVNQPLGAAVTHANAGIRWLQADPPNLQKAKDAFAAIAAAGHRAADIVTRIRALVRKAPTQEAEVDINQEILGMVALTANEAMRHSVTVRTELAGDLPAITGDRIQLQQLLLNLMVNAIEAMHHVPGVRELVICSEADGSGGAVVAVRDSGPGIEPASLELVFEPLYTSKAQGLGLGLSVCQSIVEAHGGRLWASANSPRGAIFHFTLPNSRT